MRFNQFDIEEHRNILLFTLDENKHGDYPFFIQNVALENFDGILHRHEYFQIYYISKGKLKHRINNKEFDLVKGDVFVIPPYTPHSVATCDNVPCEAIELEFKPEFINQSFRNDADVKSFLDFMYIEPFMVVRPRLSLSGKLEFDVESILNDFMYEFNKKKPGFELMTKSMILKLLAMLGREAAYEHHAPEKVTLVDKQRDSILKVVNYLEEHYTEKIYLEDAVKLSLLSYSNFCMVFKSVTNKSFTRYLNELRVSRAKEYLKKTDNKIIDICSKSGFENVTHFNRTFKQITSLTPREYKQVNR
ncbi:AraC family transcriptional regulator [Paenibacillus eucommiae]|uniref:AraC-like DNA-binding protein/mannose-6-phosphate isomerase-like protein (Cupin superfamily) n=1 Tax=Paenibacillus eucommiae TaxID=1355755 RepID=A0ABS4IPZ0_9BACL|nr:AraC family transcriptional regulator [Paenibacillus eucommiae]MBP1988679.1 AraC-like DNA-binding protein/mannose-6-phosphate isomerase-like protein (cupin superfamily) [Paenibacillus eucommiae]